jgi:hypothetical protein
MAEASMHAANQQTRERLLGHAHVSTDDHGCASSQRGDSRVCSDIERGLRARAAWYLSMLERA